MKPFKYIIIVFLLKATISYSSDLNTKSIESFKLKIDRLNKQITIKYLETLKNPSDSLNLIDLKKSISIHKFDINGFFLLLDKHHFKKTKDNLSIKVDSIKNLVAKKKDINLFFQKIEDAELKSINVINDFFIKERSKLAPNFRKENNNKRNYNLSNNEDFIFNTILFIVCFLVILILSYTIFKYHKKNKILINEIEIIKKTNQTSINQTHYEKTKVELIKKENEIIDLKNKISRLLERNVSEDFLEIDEKIELNSLSENKITLYFRSPISDGSFSNDHQSNTVEYANTMFKFELEKNRNIAQFEFFGDKNVLDHAINFSELNIQKVCNYQNSKDDFKTQIITIEPGVAELQGDKWIVKQKAKIKFD